MKITKIRFLMLIFLIIFAGGPSRYFKLLGIGPYLSVWHVVMLHAPRNTGVWRNVPLGSTHHGAQYLQSWHMCSSAFFTSLQINAAPRPPALAVFVTDPMSAGWLHQLAQHHRAANKLHCIGVGGVLERLLWPCIAYLCRGVTVSTPALSTQVCLVHL